ncbi:MAG: hypothetical protein AMJ90_02275 [candidate division Zixibacteria bacterium SM23_73_2]|nr:MAG: hypothetical protein AMJ90_02275 [candidate division Zixibacteria bacterium SM23_73_2]
MKESTIRKLIKLVEESNVEELEVSSWGRKVRITKRLDRKENPAPKLESQEVIQIPVEEKKEKPQPEPADQLVPIKSPMVGTFYRAPAPDAKPYVELNQMITMGQVVCIIEAMKLMNEIESEVAGRVAKVLVENGKPVEYGQVLFLMEPS